MGLVNQVTCTEQECNSISLLLTVHVGKSTQYHDSSKQACNLHCWITILLYFHQ